MISHFAVSTELYESKATGSAFLQREGTKAFCPENQKAICRYINLTALPNKGKDFFGHRSFSSRYYLVLHGNNTPRTFFVVKILNPLKNSLITNAHFS